MSDVIDINSYATVWSCLLFGMSLGVAIAGMVRPTPVLIAALAGMFLFMALGVRPFIYMLVAS